MIQEFDFPRGESQRSWLITGTKNVVPTEISKVKEKVLI